MSNNKKILTIGNITTIVNTIIVILCGYLVTFLVTRYGIQLPLSQTELASFLSSVVFAVFAVINARNHNTFWDKETDTISISIDDLTDEEQKIIQNIIDNAVTLDTLTKTNRVESENGSLEKTEFSPEENIYIEDIDVAGEYDE